MTFARYLQAGRTAEHVDQWLAEALSDIDAAASAGVRALGCRPN